MKTIKDIVFNTQHKLDMKDAEIKPSDQKALLVDLEVSVSGKVINGRIYPASGQKNTTTWLKPFPKPVQLNHDDDVKSTIGRFISAQWVDTEKEALGFLKGNTAALADIKRAFINNNPKVIYSTMKKYGAFDKNWPGLGKIVGKVRITDQDAIQRFADQRYLTVSAGQGTDALTCLNCGSEWHNNDMCDHKMGGTDEEGNPVVFLCGNMSGKEVSVVNNPANDTSVVLAMALSDSENNGLTITFTDSIDDAVVPVVTMEKQMILKDLEALEIPTVLALLADEAKLKEFTDAIAGDTEYEVAWLVRVHDALHGQYDYQLKYQTGDTQTMPKAVYALHAAIHNTAMDKNFRDSLTNGELDGYDAEGDESSEFQYPSTDDSKALVLTDEIKQALFEEFKKMLGDTHGQEKEVKVEAKENEPEPVLADSDADPNTDDIDWETLDLALEAMMGDAKLSSEKRKSLGASTFCGPDRSFPVPDCAHVTAARRLIGRAKLSSDQKTRVLACVSRKAKSLGCDSSDSAHTDCDCKKPCASCAAKDEKYKEIKADYAEALLQQAQLKDQLITTLRKVSKSIRPDVDVTDEKLDNLLDWANKMGDNLVVKEQPSAPAKNLKPVENPSIGKQNHTASDSTLTGFQKQVVNTYKDKLKESKQKADQYLIANSRYLPSDFKITNYVDITKE